MEQEQTDSQRFLDRARSALRDPGTDIFDAWTSQLPPTHRLLRDDRAFAIATKGPLAHASEEEILTMSRALLDGDWGSLLYQDDIDMNETNAARDRGIVMGVYTTPDGTELWATQGHRLLPPTVMLPEEH